MLCITVQVTRLSNMVKESEQGLGSASTHINSLKEAAATLKSELDKTRAELKAAKIHSANVQVSNSTLCCVMSSMLRIRLSISPSHSTLTLGQPVPVLTL